MRKDVTCVCCDSPIYRADATHEQDVCYQIDGDYICEDCLRTYADENLRVELEEYESC